MRYGIISHEAWCCDLTSGAACFAPYEDTWGLVQWRSQGSSLPTGASWGLGYFPCLGIRVRLPLFMLPIRGVPEAEGCPARPGPATQVLDPRPGWPSLDTQATSLFT